MTHVYKIVSRREWAAAAHTGVFEGSPVDLKDGYIHLSAGDQVAETARLHFAGRSDLLLLSLEAETLGSALRWEASRGGALFPHLYAPLATVSVLEARPLPLGEGGVPDLSGLLH